MKRSTRLAHRFTQHMGRLAIPTVVLAELYAGARLRTDRRKLLDQIADLRVFLEVIDFDAPSAAEFGRLRGVLQRGACRPRRSTS